MNSWRGMNGLEDGVQKRSPKIPGKFAIGTEKSNIREDK
jgi:hypothetical protein